MKRMYLFALAMVLALTLLAGQAGASEGAALPQTGDVVHGFEVMEISRFDLLGADLVRFEHQRTGAQLLYIANEDTNRVYEITFKTPPQDDKGVPHVFEHATLDGSAKYPSKALFFNLSYQTYNTYMNAATYSVMTTYPVASLSEKQLYKLADYYTDSCFNPLVYTNKNLFLEEAWRYALTDRDSDLTLAGTVYSEMQGAYTLQRAAGFNFLKTLFPGSTAGNVFGGLPADIPQMAWEDLTAYHSAYYHPSNTLTCLYGSFEDYAAFLELLDGYFAPYERKDIAIADAGYQPLAQGTEVVFEFPLEAGSATENTAMVYYGMLCGDATAADIDALDLLTTVLAEDSSPLKQNLKTALPSAQASCYIEITGPEPALVFYAANVNGEDAQLFRDTVNQSLRQIAEEGFDQESIDAIAASIQLETLLMGESSTLGVDMIPSIAYYWASTDDVYGYIHYIDTLALIDDYAADGTFRRVMETYLIDNPRTALVATVPAAGLKEARDAELAAELAAVKAGMTEDEIDALIAATAAFGAEEDDDAAQYVAQLQAVTVESLPEEKRIYDVNDQTGADGVRRMDALAEVDGVGQTLLLLDISGLPQEDIHWLNLYLALLGEIDTTAHTRAQLAALTTRYLYSGSIRLSVLDAENAAGFVPRLRVSFIAMDEDMQPAYDLVRELLFDTRLDDAQAVLDVIASTKAALKQNINNNAHNILAYRAFASSDGAYAYYDYANHLAYYAFLEKAEQLLADEPQAALQRLSAVREAVNNSCNAVSAFAGNAQSIALHRAVADGFLAGLNHADITPAVYAFPQIGEAEGLIVDSAVQYNLLYAPYEALGREEFTGDLDAVTALVSDKLLYPLLRDQYGAYGVMHYGAGTGVYIISYRDPNVRETFLAYAGLPEAIRNMAVDQETLDGYILSAYSGYAQSSGELTGALSALLSLLEGEAQEVTLDYMRALKGIKADSLAQYADMYQLLLDNGVIATAGGAAAVNANADLYETVLNPFGVADTTQVTLSDIAPEDPYFQAVRFCFENSVLPALDGSVFGVDAPATLGEFAAACYQMLGGPANAAEAIEFLAGYAIVPAGDPADALTREDMTGYAYSFCAAVGMDVTPAAPPAFDDAADVTPGMEEIFGWALQKGYLLPQGDTTLAPQAAATRAHLALLLMGVSVGE